MKSLKESLFDRDLISKDIKFKFAGLEINPMPVIYKRGKFQFADSWDELSYKKACGLKEGSTYFSWDDCHDIKIGQWRVPTEREWEKIINRGIDTYDFFVVDSIPYQVIYPDNYEIEIVRSKNISKEQLDKFCSRGCLPIPFTGFYFSIAKKWRDKGLYGDLWTSTASQKLETAYYAMLSERGIRVLSFNKDLPYFPVLLVK